MSRDSRSTSVIRWLTSCAAKAIEGGPDPRPLLGIEQLFGDTGHDPRLANRSDAGSPPSTPRVPAKHWPRHPARLASDPIPRQPRTSAGRQDPPRRRPGATRPPQANIPARETATPNGKPPMASPATGRLPPPSPATGSLPRASPQPEASPRQVPNGKPPHGKSPNRKPSPRQVSPTASRKGPPGTASPVAIHRVATLKSPGRTPRSRNPAQGHGDKAQPTRQRKVHYKNQQSNGRQQWRPSNNGPCAR